MAEMKIIKTNEKIIIWMHRTGITGQQIANKIGITRQAWSVKLKENIFSPRDLFAIRNMGFKE